MRPANEELQPQEIAMVTQGLRAIVWKNGHSKRSTFKTKDEEICSSSQIYRWGAPTARNYDGHLRSKSNCMKESKIKKIYFKSKRWMCFALAKSPHEEDLKESWPKVGDAKRNLDGHPLPPKMIMKINREGVGRG